MTKIIIDMPDKLKKIIDNGKGLTWQEAALSIRFIALGTVLSNKITNGELMEQIYGKEMAECIYHLDTLENWWKQPYMKQIDEEGESVKILTEISNNDYAKSLDFQFNDDVRVYGNTFMKVLKNGIVLSDKVTNGELLELFYNRGIAEYIYHLSTLEKWWKQPYLEDIDVEDNN